nr:fibrobacter succinogenes major paralogous domain-containing protein [Bacteroidales bacterium]
MKKTPTFPVYLLVLVATVSVLVTGCKKESDEPSVIKDGDGNVYTSVKIGTQSWLAENLKTTKLNDGTSIPLVTDYTEWKNLATPGYCWYNNDKATYGNTYGPLYNWYAVETGKLCPKGWHVPSNDEMVDLDLFVVDKVGGKLKEMGTTHWRTPNTGATDQYGFKALPGGYRDLTFFDDIYSYGAWWTCSERTQLNYGYVSILIYDTDNWSPYAEVHKNFGYSVRCLKD